MNTSYMLQTVALPCERTLALATQQFTPLPVLKIFMLFKIPRCPAFLATDVTCNPHLPMMKSYMSRKGTIGPVRFPNTLPTWELGGNFLRSFELR